MSLGWPSRGSKAGRPRAEASKHNSNSVDERRQEISLVDAYPTGQQLVSPWPRGAARPAGSALDVRRRSCVVRN